MKNVVLVAILFAFLMPLRALGADFSGQWVLDAGASQKLDPIFDMQEVSWAKRKVAETLDSSFTIAQSADRMTITYSNVVGTFNQVLIFDNKPHATKNPAGRTVTLNTQWSGEALVSTGETQVGESGSGVITAHRSLSGDGNIMNMTIKLQSNGQSATVKRVFRRAQ